MCCMSCQSKHPVLSFLFIAYMPSQFMCLINNHHVPPLKKVSSRDRRCSKCLLLWKTTRAQSLCQKAHNCCHPSSMDTCRTDLESGRRDFFYNKKQSSLPGGQTFSSFNSKKHKPEVWCIRAGKLAQRQSA